MSLRHAAQLRAARGLLNWTQATLSEQSGISLPTVKRLESSEGLLRVRLDTIEKLRGALEAAGVEFIAENGGGPGVRLRK